MAFVFLNPVENQLDALRQQIQTLYMQRAQHIQAIENIDAQINQFTTILQSMEPIASQSAVHNLYGKSLADLCRLALDAYGGWVTAHQVRDYLEQLGVRFHYNNVMAVLHNTLKRVGQSGRDNFGNTVYAPK